MAESTLDDILSRHGLTKERLQEECLQEVRLKIAAKLEDWKMVGHFLSISTEKLKAIERENDTEDLRRVAMLDTWHKREGKDANCLRLANALYQHGRRDLVELLCEALISSSAVESSKMTTQVPGSAFSLDIDRFRSNSGKFIGMDRTCCGLSK